MAQQPSASPITQETPVFRAFETNSLSVPTELALSGDLPTELKGTSAGASEAALPPTSLLSARDRILKAGHSSRPAGLTTSSKTAVEKRSGRPPWYDALGKTRDAYVIGIAGGSASGKTSVANRVLTRLSVPTVAMVGQDSFYKELNTEQSKMAFDNNWNFDCEDAFDQQLLKECIIDLKRGQAAEVPVYSFVQHQRTEETKYLYGASVIIVEGLFVLSDPEIRQLLDLKLFVQADSDTMLARRIMRDTKERGRSVDGVIEHYLRWVKPAMDSGIQPTSKWADLIVPGQRNEVAVEVVAQHVRRQLDARAHKVRAELSKTPTTPALFRNEKNPFDTNKTPIHHSVLMSRTPSSSSLVGDAEAVTRTNNLAENSALPSSVHLLAPTPQLLGLLTIMHDATTSAEEFIFTTDRLCQMLMEDALGFLPYREKRRSTLATDPDCQWRGPIMDVDDVCSIAIQRSGGVLEKAARRAVPALTQGSLLIQSSDEDGEPQLYDVGLPSLIRKRATARRARVLLLDAQIGTGAAAFMGIRVLLDHSVPEENIIFVSILASAKGGIWAIARAFPKVRIVLAGVDRGLKKCRIQYPALENPARANQHKLGSRGVEEEEEVSQNGVERPPRGYKTKTIWAITPGCGSIGDRYYRTD